MPLPLRYPPFAPGWRFLGKLSLLLSRVLHPIGWSLLLDRHWNPPVECPELAMRLKILLPPDAQSKVLARAGEASGCKNPAGADSGFLQKKPGVTLLVPLNTHANRCARLRQQYSCRFTHFAASAVPKAVVWAHCVGRPIALPACKCLRPASPCTSISAARSRCPAASGLASESAPLVSGRTIEALPVTWPR